MESWACARCMFLAEIICTSSPRKCGRRLRAWSGIGFQSCMIPLWILILHDCRCCQGWCWKFCTSSPRKCGRRLRAWSGLDSKIAWSGRGFQSCMIRLWIPVFHDCGCCQGWCAVLFVWYMHWCVPLSCACIGWNVTGMELWWILVALLTCKWNPLRFFQDSWCPERWVTRPEKGGVRA